MSTGYKISEQDGLHYVTFQIIKWIDIFTRQVYRDIIYGNGFMDQKIKYIHENPVRAGIVERAEDYLYSSARSYAGLEGLIDVEKSIFQ